MFFFNDTATTEIYTLSLHDALPISSRGLADRPVDIGPDAARVRGGRARGRHLRRARLLRGRARPRLPRRGRFARSEEHTSELQSRQYLVCRLLLEKKHSITVDTIHT